MTAQSVARRTLDAVVPFMIGLVMGIMGTLVSFSGQISAIQTTVNAQQKTLVDLEANRAAMHDVLLTIQARLPKLVP